MGQPGDGTGPSQLSCSAQLCNPPPTLVPAGPLGSLPVTWPLCGALGCGLITADRCTCSRETSVSWGWGDGEGNTVTHSTLRPPFCSVSFRPGAGGPAKEDLPSSFPSPFFVLETKAAPLPHRGHIQGSAAARGHHQRCLGVGRESRWAPSQPEVAKQLPLLQKILMRKGLLISKHWGPFLCSSGSAAQTRGCGWLKVTWLTRRRGQGRDLTYVHSLKDSEGATGHNSMEPAPH